MKFFRHTEKRLIFVHMPPGAPSYWSDYVGSRYDIISTTECQSISECKSRGTECVGYMKLDGPPFDKRHDCYVYGDKSLFEWRW